MPPTQQVAGLNLDSETKTILTKIYRGPPQSLQANVDVKGKAILVQAWTGPEGSRRFRLSDFKTIST